MADERDFIQQTIDRALIHNGEEISPDGMAREFAKLGPVDRLNHLDRMKSEMPEGLSIAAAAERHSYSSKLHAMHQALRKINR